MIIGVSGLGYSGSGAVIDFLKEYDELKVLDNFEFNFAYYPDGLLDLENALMINPQRYYSSDVAIRRFKAYVKALNTRKNPCRKLTNNKFLQISRDYIDSIIQAQWKGFWSIDYTDEGFFKKNFHYRLGTRLMRIFDKIFKKNTNIPPNREMYLSVKPENFYTASRNYICGILNACGIKNEEKVVLDQPFSGDHPEASFKFFDNPKAIIVKRDPRDIYLYGKQYGSSFSRFIPTDDVKVFIKYYKLLNTKFAENDRILCLNFENLIYQYENAKVEIETFLNLAHNSNPPKHFIPTESINNTQLFKRNDKYSDDIKLIESELSEYLFPFEKFKFECNGGKIF